MIHIKSIQCLLTFVLIIGELDFARSQASARLIKIPLARGTTQGAGSSGQPVISYYTPLSLGTPPKVFNIQFDVGLSNSFLPHYEWSPFKINLHYSKGFQCKESSTCKKTDQPYVFEYQHCKLTGKPYEDVLTFSGVYGMPNNTHTALRQNFLAISDASDSRFKGLPIDGFFGLAPILQSPTGINNLLFTLHNARLIDNLQFSLWFNSILDSPQGGELTLGGQDTARYQGQVYWHHISVTSSQKWALSLQYVSIGNQLVSCNGQQCIATLNSGLNEVFGPKDDVQKIYHILNTTRSGGLELVDCRRISNLPILSFSIDGIPYYLLPSNYVRKTANGTIFKTETCYVAIMPSLDDNIKEWVLGTNFLGAYYSIYDITQRQVGFASLR